VRSDSPVRMYLREMGKIPLFKQKDERDYFPLKFKGGLERPGVERIIILRIANYWLPGFPIILDLRILLFLKA